jgi:tRNA dimethylallyltransferase
MDIGTAKPSPAEQKILPHYLIDIKNPNEQYSVAEFVQEADALCDRFHKEGKLPIVCGGTGFYIRAFLLGLPKTPEGDESLREKLKKELLERGKADMWKELLASDPDSAKKIDPADSYRVLRALEIYRLTGKPRAAFAQSPKLRDRYDFTTIILERDRDDLYKRIEERVDKMFEAGLESEARGLMASFKKEDPGMQAIGYREFFETKDGGFPLATEEIKERIKRDSKKYAKKQYVFMRGIPGATTIRVSDSGDALSQMIELLRAKNTGGT